MKKIVILLILLSSLSYSQLSITQGIYTIHTTDEVEFNDRNGQLGIEYNNIYLQYMRSSFNDDTFSLTYNIYLKQFYVGLGFAKGYTKRVDRVTDTYIYHYEYKPYIDKGYSWMAYIGYEVDIVENVSMCISYAPDCVNMLLKIKLID